MTSEQIQVALGSRSYPIFIGTGLLDQVGERLRQLQPVQKLASRAFVVTDSRVAELYLSRATASLRQAEFTVTAIQIPEGEQHKNLAWLALLYDRLIEAQIERSSPIVALGGGVIGDLAGFAAATVLRGVPFVQVPTTLLAQVDASIGGKTGINHPAGKNLIGAFHQPRLVLIDIETLRTLAKREYLAGLAEVVKYAVILDPDLFALLEKNVAAVVRQDVELLTEIVSTCCRLKAMVVEEDERESDTRAILNFGHTVGHAVETLTEYRKFLHGEAVAVGMACAARLSRQCGLLPAAEEERIVALLKAVGLPTQVPSNLASEQIALTIAADKKAAGGKIKFVCVEKIGRTRFQPLSPAEIAEGTFHS